MAHISIKDFEKGIDDMRNAYIDGVVYFPIDKTDDGKTIALVLGWQDGYNDGETYQTKMGDTTLTLCGKIAVNIDDLQCDYGWDWYMPEVKGMSDVFDTGLYLSKNPEGLKKDYDYICELVDKVLDGYKNGDLV